MKSLTNSAPAKKRAQKGTFKRVLRLVGKHPFALVFTLLFSLVTVIGSLYIPILVGEGIDLVVGKGAVDFSGLFKVFLKIGISVGIAALAQWLTSVCNEKIACRVVHDLREEAFAKLERLPLSYLDKRGHGEMVSRIISDAEQFSEGLLMGFTQFFTGVLTIFGTIAFMFVTGWKIALVVVFVTPLSLFVAKFITSKTHGFFVRQAETRAEQTAFTEETIAGLKTVQAFSREDESLERFDEINARLEKASMNAVFFSSLTNPSTRFVNNLVYALVALLGAFAILSGGGFTVGKLTVFLSYANQYTKPFNEISGVVAELQNALVCASRIFELIDEREEPSDDGLPALGEATGSITFDKVAFSYRADQKLIEDFTLDVKTGQKIAIVGPTGSGKTTLINLLMRFYDVTGGALTLDGNDLRTITRSSLRENFGMVLQDTWLKTGTVRENIVIGKPNASEAEIISAAKAAHADGFIRRLPKGYDTPLSEDGESLSQGQKQLLCIARIMLCVPPVLLLDEATSSIDTRTEKRIGDAFDKLTAGRTSFVVAHRLSTIKSADLILVMNEGRVVEQGTHGELLQRHGVYHKLYHSQFE